VLLKLYLAMLYLALGTVGMLFMLQGYWPVTFLLWSGNAIPGVLLVQSLGKENAN